LYVFDKSKQKFKNIFRLIKTFRKNRYTEIINLQRFASSGIITILSGAKKTVGFDKNPMSVFYSKHFSHELDGRHEVERNLSLISDLGATQKTRPKLYPTKADYEKINALIQTPYYCLAPASVWFTKQLPKEKWVELIHLLPSPHTIYLIGGKADFALCEEIKALAQAQNVQNIAGTLSLLQSAALFETSKRTYVNDSGPLHLCSAVNAPVTAFFCSTVPSFGFTPLSEDTEILQTTENLACRPCGLHGFKSCPQGHFKCGDIELSVKK
jgi:heptosyltransferase II